MKIPEKALDVLRRSLSKKFIERHPLLVGNNCFASWIYNYSHTPFNHPLQYGIINSNHIETLINSFWDIDFKNVQFDLISSNGNLNREKTYVRAKIDNALEIHYIHYLKHVSGKKMRFDIVADDILDIASEKYERRLERLQEIRGKETPFFLFNYYSSDICGTEVVNVIDKTKSRKDVQFVYEKMDKRDMDFNRSEFPNVTTYNRFRKRNMLYTLLEYLNDKCK